MFSRMRFVSSALGFSRSTQRKRFVSPRRVGIKKTSMSLLCRRPCVVNANDRIMHADAAHLCSYARQDDSTVGSNSLSCKYLPTFCDGEGIKSLKLAPRLKLKSEKVLKGELFLVDRVLAQPPRKS